MNFHEIYPSFFFSNKQLNDSIWLIIQYYVNIVCEI